MTYSLIAGVVVGVLMLIVSLILKYGSVKRNYLFGYRTFRSLKNESNWIFANKKSSIYLFYLSFFSILLGILSILYGFDTKFVVLPVIVLLILIIMLVEIELYQFDKRKKDDTNKSV